MPARPLIRHPGSEPEHGGAAWLAAAAFDGAASVCTATSQAKG